MKRNEITLVTEKGVVDTMWFHGQPTTDDIASSTSHYERWIIQQVGAVYEVYDRRSLRAERMGHVLGLPVFSHESLDAAIMWAVMRGTG